MGVFLSFCIATLVIAESKLADQSFLSENITQNVQPPMRRLILGAGRPAHVRITPPERGVDWCTWSFGPKDAARSITLALCPATAAVMRAWADGNGDGDFSNDPPVACEPVKNAAGQTTHWQGGFYVTAPAICERPLRLKFIRYTSDEAARRKLPDNLLFCFGDYGWKGRLAAGGKHFDALLTDGFATGDFSLPRDGATGLNLYVDVNANGTYEGPERFEPNETIQLGNAAVTIARVSPDGREIALNDARPDSPRIRPDAATADMGPAPKFTAKDMDGKTVSFPGDYKGKLVLLDFWATWCGPCQAEIPHLVKANGKYRTRGLEILGATIDNPGQHAKLKKFLAAKGMTWRQVYPAREQGGLYGVSSIPRAFLVDGDTGQIIASGRDLRGNALDATLSTALDKKFGPARP